MDKTQTSTTTPGQSGPWSMHLSTLLAMSCVTRLIFKWRKTDFKSEFSFS